MWSACAKRARRALCSGTESFYRQGRPPNGRLTRAGVREIASNSARASSEPAHAKGALRRGIAVSA